MAKLKVVKLNYVHVCIEENFAQNILQSSEIAERKLQDEQKYKFSVIQFFM